MLYSSNGVLVGTACASLSLTMAASQRFFLISSCAACSGLPTAALNFSALAVAGSSAATGMASTPNASTALITNFRIIIGPRKRYPGYVQAFQLAGAAGCA